MQALRYHVIVFSLLFSGILFGQNFVVPVNVSDGNNNRDLDIGVSPIATDGFDPQIDFLAPPPAPGGSFDTRIAGPVSLLRDIRSNTIDEKLFSFSYQAGNGFGPIVLSWDSALLSTLGTFTIVDDITGELFGPIDMTTINSLVASDPLIAGGLRILMTPFYVPNQPPVLDPIDNQTMFAGDTLQVDISATDPEHGNITLTAENLPSFSALTDSDDGTGFITFTPAPGDTGIFTNIRVIAADDSAAADTVSFDLTVSPEEIVLNPPENLNATPGNSVVNLTWAAPAESPNLLTGIGLAFVRDQQAIEHIAAKNVNQNNISSTILTGYRIYRSENQADFAVVDSVDARTTTYSDNSVINGTTYAYYVTAVYDVGESDPSNTAGATPTADEPTIVFEEIFQDTLPPDGWIVQDVDGSGNAWQFIQEDPLVEPQAGASFWWSNFSNANGFRINEYLISPQIPAANFTQLSFYATAVGGTFDDSLRIWISTTGNTVEDFADMIGYIRIDGPAGEWRKYTFDISAFAGQSIYFAVNYFHTRGGPNGTHSDNVWVDHFQVVASGFLLDPPTDLAASAGDQNVDLTWTSDIGSGNLIDQGTFELTRGDIITQSSQASNDDQLSNTELLAFNIYRASDDRMFSQVGSVDPEVTNYTDENVVNDVTYLYYVTALYDQGESASSDTVAATPMASGQSIIFEEIFADSIPPEDWQVIDNDGSGGAWTFRQQLDFQNGQVFPESGSSFWWSNFNNANGFLIDEYLVSPQIPAANFDSLFFYAGAIGDQFTDSLRVYISTSGTDVADFKNLLGYFIVNGPIGNWTRYGFDLSVFSGRDIHIGVNYYHTQGGPNGSHSNNVWVDHFIVTESMEDTSAAKTLFADLNGYQEVPPVQTSGTGNGVFSLSEDSTAVRYEINLARMSSNVFAAHIHEGAAFENGPVVFTIFSEGTISGDTTLAGTWTSQDAEPLTPELVEALCNNQLYVNIHSDNYMPGEIRGQINSDRAPDLSPAENLDASSNGVTIDLNWDAPPTGIQPGQYNVYRAVNMGDFAFLDSPANSPYTDSSATSGETYQYYVTAIYSAGQSIPTDTVSTAVTGIDDAGNVIPTAFALDQNYPNPFNPTTSLTYALKENAAVHLNIYNTLGQLVRSLVNERQNAGFKTVTWDGRSNAGEQVASGIYIYRLEALPGSGTAFIQSRKMIMLK